MSSEMTGQDCNEREEYGSHVFSKICMHAIAIQKIIPYSRYNQNPNEQIWDLASLPALIRDLVETYYHYFYIMMEKVSDDEINFRFDILKYHSHSERLRMVKQRIPKSTAIQELEDDKAAAKQKVIDNPLCQIPPEIDKEINPELYKKLDRLYKKIRKGEKAVLKSDKQLNKAANINENYYKSMYKYLSQFTHTTKFSIDQIGAFRHFEDEHKILFIEMLNYAINYLALSIRDFAKSFDLVVDKPIQFIEESELFVKMFSPDQEA